jgi:hypothetical protein
MEYVKTGTTSDTTPPTAPTHVRARSIAEQGIEITWDADADFESGIRQFVVLRDGQEIGKVPSNPVGKFGRPLYQSMTYHDTPGQPLAEMRFVDSNISPSTKHSYQVISINSVELSSQPSAAAKN